MATPPTGRRRGPKPRDGEPTRQVTIRLTETAHLHASVAARDAGIPLAVWIARVIAEEAPSFAGPEYQHRPWKQSW